MCTAGCSSSAASASSSSTEQGHPEMPDPFPSLTFDFTYAMPDIPDAYTVPASQQGGLTKFYYATKNYDGDGRDEIKYATVYTPYGYDASKQYSIMYLMHGWSGSADDWLGTPGEPSEIKYCIDHLIQNGEAEPMIIAALTYYDDNTDEQTDNWDINLTKAFSTEFINDVMPAVESSYSTYALTADEAGLSASRSHRIFGGFSMGGVTTWYQFCNSLKYVRYFYPASGSLYWGPDVDGKDQYFGGRYASEAMAAQGYGKDDFYMYMTTGSEDYAKTIVDAQIGSMLLYPDIFSFGSPEENGINCSYGISDGEDHDFHGRLRDIYALLPVFSKKISSSC
jgi:hypothetical protein